MNRARTALDVSRAQRWLSRWWGEDSHVPDPLSTQCRAEGCGILGISIHDQEPCVPKEWLLGIEEIPRYLHHPHFVRMGGVSPSSPSD
jgi:hypothetical protein